MNNLLINLLLEGFEETYNILHTYIHYIYICKGQCKCKLQRNPEPHLEKKIIIINNILLSLLCARQLSQWFISVNLEINLCMGDIILYV